MNLKKYNIKLILLITIIVTTVLSSTYAFVNFIATQTTSNVTAGCTNVTYSGQNIDNSALISSTTYTEEASSQVVLSKNSNCKIYTEATIKIHTNETTTAPINVVGKEALKYKIIKESGDGEIISGGEGIINQFGDTTLAKVSLTETNTTYKVYIWIDSSISAGTYNGTTYSGYIFAESTQKSTIDS